MFNSISIPLIKRLIRTESNRIRSRKVALGAVLGLCLVFGWAQAVESFRPARSYSLTSRIKALAGEYGALEIFSSELAVPLVRGSLDPLVDSRRQRTGDRPLQSFLSHSREGIPGGQRGFSAQADDDGDGMVDEDRLDGWDNDGDGLIDEDYAAISDAMTAVHLSQGAGWAQLEFMHWAGTRLQNALFLNFSAEHEFSGTTTAYYRLESSGEAWQEVDVYSRHHSMAGQSISENATAFVLQVETLGSVSSLTDPSALDTSADSAFSWLGVLVLDQNRTHRPLRPKLDGALLSLPLYDEPTPAVICTADSWLQLNRLLLDAVLVYRGLQDPVSGREALWIVNPLCLRCRVETDVEFTAELGPNGDFSLSFVLEPGRSCFMDPDLFILEGTALGAPDEIFWMPATGASANTPWSGASSAGISQLEALPRALYGLLGEIPDHAAEGVLNFRFNNPAAEVLELLEVETEVGLSGVWLDGRQFLGEGQTSSGASGNLEMPRTADEYQSGSETTHTQRGQLSLAPDLLEGWPNPFRDQIRIEFVIPSTTRELFDWPEDESIPEGVEFSGPVVWSSGQPYVSVKVYSINGQELVSLQNGSLAEGRYSVSWNGTDAFGRQVASGTYFCKLQLDDWSITRRLVFIR